MLKFLEKVFQDIYKGQNLEIYLTLVVALALLLLDIFGIASTEAVAAGTLATLALLAFSTLENREQMQHLADTSTATQAVVEQVVSGKPKAGDFFWKRRRSLEGDLARARFIGIAGITLSRTVRDYLDDFEKRLQSGACVRFIVIDPASLAPRQVMLRSKGGVRDFFYADLVRTTIERICILTELDDSSGTVELGLLPYAPSFGLFLIDPHEAHGRIIVEIYQHKSLAFNPTFELNAQRDARWYKFFREQFDLLWESCGDRRGTGRQIHRFRQELQSQFSGVSGKGLGEATDQG
jgi:hypothetical protein